MNKDIPKIHQEILGYIIQYKTDHDGNSPTFRQIMKACGISSTSVVSYYLQRMRVDGLIRIEPGHKGIEVVGGRWSYEPNKRNNTSEAGVFLSSGGLTKDSIEKSIEERFTTELESLPWKGNRDERSGE